MSSTESTTEGVVEGRVEPVAGPDGKPLRGVGTGEFVLPADAPEGEYTLTMQELPNPSGDPAVVPFPVSRTIRVEAGVPEVLNKRVAFAAASYSAGDAVEAWVDVRYRDKPLAGARVVSAVATVDDQTLELPDVPATDAAGRAHLRFTLPAAPWADQYVPVVDTTQHGGVPAGSRPIAGGTALRVGPRTVLLLRAERS